MTFISADESFALEGEALATVSFEGLGLFCENKRNECELGILRRDDHRVIVDIIRTEPAPGEYITFDFGDFVKIEVVDPLEKRVKRFLGPDGEPLKHPRDFRWMIDLEGQQFHKGPVTFEAGEAKLAQRLSPVFFIASGLMYTLELTGEKERLARVRWDDEAQARFLAGEPPEPDDVRIVERVGHKLGIDLLCADKATSSLILTSVDKDGNPVAGVPRVLPGGNGVKYEIQISNSCAEPNDCAPAIEPGAGLSHGTDFRFYYDLIKDRERVKKFDLRLIEESSTPRVPILGEASLGLACFPQACHLCRMSATTNLPTGR